MAKNSKANKIVNNLKSLKSDRVKTSLYISKAAYKQFTAAVDKEGLSYSSVLEELMMAFVGDLKSR